MPDNTPEFEIVQLDFEMEMERLRECYIQMQDFERTIDPRIPPGVNVADIYLSEVAEECQEKDGRILAAVSGEKLLGYAVLLCDDHSDDRSDGDLRYAYLASLAVLEECRGMGIGRRLMRECEAIAKQTDKATIRIEVYAENHRAKGLYESEGYKAQDVILEKPLR